MEPMNRFLVSNRQDFKKFVDAICAIPADRPVPIVTPSYATPFQILGRLPVTSKEGFPSLPFLIDHARSFALLTDVWLGGAPKNLTEMEEVEPVVLKFHNIALSVRQRTKECLSKAEQAERPSGDLEVKWEELLESMERFATFYDDESMDKSTPPASEPAGPRPPSVTRSHRESTTALPTRPALPRTSTDFGIEADDDTPPSSSSANWDQSRQSTAPRWTEPRDSAGSSKNSSTYSLDRSDNSKTRRTSVSRDSSSKYRFFDFGSARRKAKD